MSTLTTEPGPQRAPSIEPLLTVQHLVGILKVHENCIYDLANRGELPSYKIGGMRRFRATEVEAWLEARRAISVERR